MPDAPELQAREPVGPSASNIVDFFPRNNGPMPISRRTISRRQARLVQREPELEQPSLEARDTPVDVVLEQRSASQNRRYPRRVYFERYEKRSPDSLVMGAPSSVKFARDGNHCGCSSVLSVVSFFPRCACNDGQSSTTSDSTGSASPPTNGSFFIRD